MRSPPTRRDRARDLRRQAPSPERQLWSVLRNLNQKGCHFRRQVPIGPRFVDFAWLSLKLVIEIDGDGHVAERRKSADERRDRMLSEMGFDVLRFWNSEVFTSPEDVSGRILEHANRLRMARGLTPVSLE